MKPTDLQGRIRNLDLKRGPAAQFAVHEAISNAQFAIEDRRVKPDNGRVEIVVHRAPPDGQLPLPDGDRPVDPISDIEIVDNGIGFNDTNYDSFDQCDTMLRAGRGGRGIGRLTYLVAFRRVEIESDFRVNGKWICRKFSFGVDVDGHVSPPDDSESVRKTNRTMVRLCGLREDHRRSLPIHLDRIADRIISHWMKQFVRNNLASITLRDAATGEILNLQDRFQKEFLVSHATDAIEIKGTPFSIEHVLIAAKEKRSHEVLLCGDDRVVRTEPCRGSLAIGDLIDSKTGQRFVYKACVTSPYLDEHLDSARTGFRISELPSENGELLGSQLICVQEIIKAIQVAAAKHLRRLLNPLQRQLWSRIQRFVAESAPQYRYLLKHRKTILERVSAAMSDSQLDVALHKIDLRIAGKLRKRSLEIQSLIRKGDGSEAVLNNFNRFLQEWNQRGIDQLAGYVVMRRTILELLELALSRGDDGGARSESVVHQIIAPQRLTSDEIRPEQLNLWIVDERFAFHRYLASDKPLVAPDKNLQLKGARPDIVVFDNPTSFSGDDEPYDSVVIVEFKKPFRTDFGDEDPVDQIYRYIERILEEKAKHANGRPVVVSKGVRFYAYAVCDISSTLRSALKRKGLKMTPDGDGWWDFNANYNAYIEVIPFNKLLRDAKRRNQAFFDKLGIPMLP